MRGLFAASTAVVALLTLHHDGARAADVSGVAVVPLRTSFNVLVPQFEAATGHKVKITYAGSSDLSRQLTAGEPFDLEAAAAAERGERWVFVYGGQSFEVVSDFPLDVLEAYAAFAHEQLGARAHFAGIEVDEAPLRLHVTARHALAAGP